MSYLHPTYQTHLHLTTRSSMPTLCLRILFCRCLFCVVSARLLSHMQQFNRVIMSRIHNLLFAIYQVNCVAIHVSAFGISFYTQKEIQVLAQNEIAMGMLSVVDTYSYWITLLSIIQTSDCKKLLWCCIGCYFIAITLYAMLDNDPIYLVCTRHIKGISCHFVRT